ncbi:DUF3987 domain-containing protein, partial [Klebsiella pneumoniae]|uniref:DUF3987 domain-containing protein n=1 Tax=Klebsiella pneumoniae TaxID=573 RepID=UPI003B593709
DDVPAVIPFTKKAVGLWHEWVFDTRVEIRKEEHTEEWRSLLSKRPGLTARLAGVIAAAKGEKVVSYESLGQAIVLISDLLEPHTKAAWALDEAEEVKDARRLLEHLKAN